MQDVPIPHRSEGNVKRSKPKLVCSDKVIWKILTGFNPDGSNVDIDKLIDIYSKYRLGMIPTTRDEFAAALQACDDMYKESYYDSKKRPNKEHEGYWCISMVHMMNHYMKFKKLTPIAFSADFESDEIAKDGQRKANSKSIWNGGKEFTIDSREAVRQELRNYCIKFLNKEYGPTPTDEGKPDLTTEQRKKRRRSAL